MRIGRGCALAMLGKMAKGWVRVRGWLAIF